MTSKPSYFQSWTRDSTPCRVGRQVGHGYETPVGFIWETLFSDLFLDQIRETTVFTHFLSHEKHWPVRALGETYTQTMDSSLSLDTVDQYQGSRVACLKQNDNIFQSFQPAVYDCAKIRFTSLRMQKQNQGGKEMRRGQTKQLTNLWLVKIEMYHNQM